MGFLQFVVAAVFFFFLFRMLPFHQIKLSQENRGCLIPLLLVLLGAMYLRRELLYIAADKPKTHPYPLIMGGIIVIGLLIYAILNRFDKLEGLKEKLRKYFKG